MAKIKHLLFDAANTLIHKPALWGRIITTCAEHDVFIEEELLQRNHKILSEVIKFPDRTSSEFYKQFNRELLYSCGVIPSDALIEETFKSCSYLPWEAFDDGSSLSKIDVPKSVLSNFNTTLSTHLDKYYPSTFSRILTSEELQCAKPAVEFFTRATELLGVKASDILFIGDSIKLDMEPALKAGLHAVLIDRPRYFASYQNRIESLYKLAEYIDEIEEGLKNVNEDEMKMR